MNPSFCCIPLLWMEGICNYGVVGSRAQYWYVYRETWKHEVLPTSQLQMYRPQFLLVLKTIQPNQLLFRLIQMKIQFITNQQLSLNLLSLFHNHKPSHLSFFQDFKYFEEVNVKGAPKSKWSGSCKLCLENKENMSHTKISLAPLPICVLICENRTVHSTSSSKKTACWKLQNF